MAEMFLKNLQKPCKVPFLFKQFSRGMPILEESLSLNLFSTNTTTIMCSWKLMHFKPDTHEVMFLNFVYLTRSDIKIVKIINAIIKVINSLKSLLISEKM